MPSAKIFPGLVCFLILMQASSIPLHTVPEHVDVDFVSSAWDIYRNWMPAGRLISQRHCPDLHYNLNHAPPVKMRSEVGARAQTLEPGSLNPMDPKFRNPGNENFTICCFSRHGPQALREGFPSSQPCFVQGWVHSGSC